MTMTLRTLGSAAVSLAALAVVLAGCERPPPSSQQQGYRGLGMVEVDNPRTLAQIESRNAVPAPQDPVPRGGPAATTEYKNVKVLTDVSVDEFNRLMVAITEWVSPQEGCAYCHNVENLADDSPYAKVVARRMLEMTRTINAKWQNHVGETGVTCYTCHRGQPVPAAIWFEAPAGSQDNRMIGYRAGQNAPATVVGLTSLPYDPFKDLLEYAEAIRVAGTTALPRREQGASIQQTERTYGLMMHMSQAVGLNCTGCHNTQSFSKWDDVSPRRVTAWHGIRMVREVNMTYIDPLRPVFPKERLGPLGDVAKVNCTTCHQGVSKPLLGVSMLKDYRELGPPRK